MIKSLKGVSVAVMDHRLRRHDIPVFNADDLPTSCSQYTSWHDEAKYIILHQVEQGSKDSLRAFCPENVTPPDALAATSHQPFRLKYNLHVVYCGLVYIGNYNIIISVRRLCRVWRPLDRVPPPQSSIKTTLSLPAARSSSLPLPNTSSHPRLLLRSLARSVGLSTTDAELGVRQFL